MCTKGTVIMEINTTTDEITDSDEYLDDDYTLDDEPCDETPYFESEDFELMPAEYTDRLGRSQSAIS